MGASDISFIGKTSSEQQGEVLDVASGISIDSIKEGLTLLDKHFARPVHTFQYMNDRRSHVHTYKNAIDAYDDVYRMCTSGYNCYFMVNPGDGSSRGTGSTVRCKAAVTSLEYLFIDTDNASTNDVTAYLVSKNLIPHITVQSSPGRYHLYFKITPAELSASRKWAAVQLELASIPGCDKSMHDYSKLLRIPGTTHQKSHTVVTVTNIQEHDCYDLQEVYDRLGCVVPASSDVNVQYTPPERIQSGERNNAYTSYALYVANLPITNAEKLSLYKSKVILDTDHTDNEYREGNQLTPRSMVIFNTAIEKVRQERNVAITADAKTPDTAKEDKWVLPDEFYTSAPNGFGDVVRDTMANCMFPCASLTFGTLLAGASAVKGMSFITPGGSSPCLYVLNVAPSGYGKNAPMNILQNTLRKNMLGPLIENELRSDRGLLEHIKSCNGNGLYIIDEVGNLLHNISNSTEAYMTGIKRQLLQLYSAVNKTGHTLGKTTSSGKDKSIPVINNPCIAICGYTVPSVFYSVFTSANVSEGLFTRFLPILAEVKESDINIDCNPSYIISSPYFAPTFNIPELTEETAPPLVTPERTRMRYTPSARKFYTEAVYKYRKLVVANARTDESTVYTRVVEHAERVAATLTLTDTIDLDTLQYALQFVESRLHATMDNLGLITKDRGTLTQSLELAVLDCIAAKGNGCTKKQIYQSIRRKFRNMMEFKQTLDEMCSQGTIICTKGSMANSTVHLGDILPD